jgi:single-stranded-DNA-specific exonuclease
VTRRRIVIALESGIPEPELEAAVALARGLDAELLGLFVEDLDLLRFAALPFAHEIGLASAVRRRLDPAALERCVWSDGELAPAEFSIEVARALRYAAPWGQAFPEPVFDNVFEVLSWRPVGERHRRMRLAPAPAVEVEAIEFDVAAAVAPPPRVRVAYQVALDEWNGRERLQLIVRHVEPA